MLRIIFVSERLLVVPGEVFIGVVKRTVFLIGKCLSLTLNQVKIIHD
jgi:hypothetical protein